MTGAVYKSGRRNTLEYRVWSEWLEAADRLAKRYCGAIDGDDPFAYNECASVSVLAAAAACAGFVGLAEFSTAKASRENRGRAPGRSDFWMKAAGREWAFEFKQWLPVTAPKKRLESRMNAAETCAKHILSGSADAAVAGLIVPLYYIVDGVRANREQVIERARKNLGEFAKTCDFAWTVGGGKKGLETWLLFRVARRWH
ncbi:MAG TPA: hypothetical protein VGC56_04995 [Allosphingosinicella sp.]|jgi:hypothetical protein